jgi:hypothetical protein
MLTLRKAGRSANLSTCFLTGAANERYVGNGTVSSTLPLREAKKKEEEVRVWRCRGGSWWRRRATFGCRLWWARSWQRGLKAECGREARRRGNLTAREAPLSRVRCPPAVVVFGVRGRRWQRKEAAPAGKRRVEYSRRAGGGGHNGAQGRRACGRGREGRIEEEGR